MHDDLKMSKVGMIAAWITLKCLKYMLMNKNKLSKSLQVIYPWTITLSLFPI